MGHNNNNRQHFARKARTQLSLVAEQSVSELRDFESEGEGEQHRPRDHTDECEYSLPSVAMVTSGAANTANTTTTALSPPALPPRRQTITPTATAGVSTMDTSAVGEGGMGGEQKGEGRKLEKSAGEEEEIYCDLYTDVGRYANGREIEECELQARTEV